MTNFSGIGRPGLWSWLTPERAVLVMPILAGVGVSITLLSVVITPLTIRVRQQSEVVEQLTSKAEFVPVLRQQLAALKREQEARDRQLDRLLDLVAGTSELQTLLAELNDMGRLHNVAINSTKPGEVKRFQPPSPVQARRQLAPPAARGRDSRAVVISDPLLNRSLEKRSAALTVTGSFQQVLAFLQSLERLEVFVVISEMNVQRKSQQSQDDVDRFEVAMDFTLTAYGRQSMQVAQLEESAK